MAETAVETVPRLGIQYKDTAKIDNVSSFANCHATFILLRPAEMNRTLSGLQAMIVGLIPEFLEYRKSFSMLRWGQIEVKPLDGPTAIGWIVSFPLRVQRVQEPGYRVIHQQM